MLTGSCLCGAVRYELRGDPMMMYYCHCGTCQKATGTAFATNVLVRADDFVVVAGHDALSAFESSPGKRRHFCSRCGSPIYSQAEPTKHVVSVRCGTLESDPVVRPAAHSWVASKAPWFEICDALPQTPGSFA